MAAVLERLQRSLGPSRSDSDRLAEDIAVTKPRYIFSALIRLNCISDPCGFDWIEPSEIHPVTTHYYSADNLDKYLGLNDDESIPARIMVPRAAATIARRIVEREARIGELDTGVVLLEELTGLDAAERNEDADLLLDIQRTLLPVGLMATSAEQIEWLETLAAEGFSGPDASRYDTTCRRMLTATRQAAAYAEAHYRDVLGMLSQAAVGKEGYRNSCGNEDKRMILWAGYEIPTLASPMVKSAAAAQVGATTTNVVTVPSPPPPESIWCEECGTYTNKGPQGQMPRACPECKQPFGGATAPIAPIAPTVTEPVAESITETAEAKAARLEAKQAEMRNRSKR